MRGPTPSIFLDGTTLIRAYGGTSSGCGSCAGSQDLVTSENGRDGIVTAYEYDDLGRRIAATRTGVREEWDYDAAGRVLAHRRIGTDNSIITLSTSQYDVAGRIETSSDALAQETDYDYSYPSVGGMVTTVTNPEDGTVITTSWPGGETKEIAGTAAAPAKLERGVWTGGEWRKEIRIGVGGSETEWTQTFTDIAGRTVRTEFPDGAFATMTYNALGQLEAQTDPDGIVTEFEYDNRGRQAAQIIAPGTADERRTEVAYEVASAHSTVVGRTTTSVFNGTNMVVVSIDERGIDGRSQWSTRAGVTSSTTSSLPVAGGWTVTSIVPGGATTVQTYTGGRLHTVEHPGGRTETYAYDAHNRVASVTDSRTGATAFTYNAADQILTTTSPAPDAGGGALVTTYTYDAMGFWGQSRGFGVSQEFLTSSPACCHCIAVLGSVKRFWGQSRVLDIESGLLSL